MLNESDQYKLRDRSSWDEDRREWSIPLFILNKIQDEVGFPTIGAKARVQQTKDERALFFPSERASGRLGKDSNSSNSVTKQRNTYSDVEHDAYVSH